MKKSMLLVILITTFFSCTELLDELNVDTGSLIDSLQVQTDTVIVVDTTVVKDSVSIDPVDSVTTEDNYSNDQKAFSPMGWASVTTTGGAGGKIIKVTNLDKEGAGSLKAALGASGPRIIVFEVGGTIDLNGATLYLKNSDVTIKGETAPSPGITLTEGALTISADNVIMRHIRIRTGDRKLTSSTGWQPDCLTINGSHNVIIDHCSFSWSIDELFTITGYPYFQGSTPEEWRENSAKNITVSNCIIGNPLHHSIHPDKGANGHGFAQIVGPNVSNVALVRNLYANSFDRNPSLGDGSRVAIVNNYTYNSYTRHLMAGHKNSPDPSIDERGYYSIIGNVTKSGPNTIKSGGIFFQIFDNCTYYMDDNRSVNNQFSSDKWVVEYNGYSGTSVSAPPSKAWHSSIEVLTSQEAEEHVLDNAGARPWDRDIYDTQTVTGVKKGTGTWIDSQEEVGGYPIDSHTYSTFNPEDWGL